MRHIFNLFRRIKNMLTLSNVQTKAKNPTKLNIVINEPEWKEICRECYSIAKSKGWKKSDSKKLLKQIRKNNDFETN